MMGYHPRPITNLQICRIVGYLSVLFYLPVCLSATKVFVYTSGHKQLAACPRQFVTYWLLL